MIQMTLYRLLMLVLRPLADTALNRRLQAGKENPHRLSERRAVPSCGRPLGMVIWLHAASVGESVAILPLIKQIKHNYPSVHILVTSGTVTSADILAQRLPDGAIHQFVPLDMPDFVDSFFNHWQPNLAIFVESEIWPNLIERSHKRRIPLALINARMSRKSERQWQRLYGLIRHLSAMFDCVLSASPNDNARLQRLGFNNPQSVGNIKLFAEPLPHDESVVQHVQTALSGKTMWSATCLHAEDDSIAITAHKQVRANHPTAVAIFAPRHPERAEGLEKLCQQQGWSCVRLYQGENIATAQELQQADVILIDVIGRMGDVYALSPVVYLGGGFATRGGHNPMEPLRQGCVVVQGVDTANCTDAVALLDKHNLGVRAKTTEQVAQAITHMVSHPDEIHKQSKSADVVCQSLSYILDDVMEALSPLIEKAQQNAKIQQGKSE